MECQTIFFQSRSIHQTHLFVNLFISSDIWVLLTTYLGSAWSPDYWFLLASRAFVGFGLGGAPVSPILLLHILNSLVTSLIMPVYPIIHSLSSCWLAILILQISTLAYVPITCVAGIQMVTGMLILEATHSSISVLIRLLWQLLSLQGLASSLSSLPEKLLGFPILL